MIEKPTDLPANKTDSQRIYERQLSPELRETLHELVNQITVMNLCCFKVRATAERDPSLFADIERIEKTISRITLLLEKIPHAINSASTNSSHPGLSFEKAKLSASEPRKIYPLFKPPRRPR